MASSGVFPFCNFISSIFGLDFGSSETGSVFVRICLMAETVVEVIRATCS